MAGISIKNILDAIRGRYNGEANDVSVSESKIMQPVDVQSHYHEQMQTHSGAVIVPGGGNTQSDFIDCRGFDKMAIILNTDASHALRIKVLWSFDRVNAITANDQIAQITAKDARANVEISAPYAKVELRNDDGSAPHTMSAWAYLNA